MAVTFVDAVNEAYNAAPSTLTFNAATTGDMLLAFVGVKPPTRNATTPTEFTTGGTDHGVSATGGVGAGAAGDAGDVKLYFWSRVADGSEPGTTSIAWSGAPNPTHHSMCQFHKTRAGSWDLGFAFATDNAQSIGTNAVDITAATDPGFTVGDLVVVAMFVPTDNGTNSNPEIIIPGCTVGTPSADVSFFSNIGNDGRLSVWTATVTAGTSTGNPQFQCDVDITNASTGAAVIVRLREPAPEPAGAQRVLIGSEYRAVRMLSYSGSAWV
jgi:hypothetical protein